MNVTLEIWQFILLIIAFLGAMAAVGKLLLEQVLVRMDDKFKAQGEAAIGFQSSLSKRLDGLEQSSRAEREQWQRIERELLTLKADLPVHYVRREDYVQTVAVLMAKLDTLAMRIENILLRNAKNEP